jgi:hypothetical protein
LRQRPEKHTSLGFAAENQAAANAPFADLGFEANLIRELSWRREGLQLLGLLLNSLGQLLFVS